jgi:hypothetical protein
VRWGVRLRRTSYWEPPALTSLYSAGWWGPPAMDGLDASDQGADQRPNRPLGLLVEINLTWWPTAAAVLVARTERARWAAAAARGELPIYLPCSLELFFRQRTMFFSHNKSV